MTLSDPTGILISKGTGREVPGSQRKEHCTMRTPMRPWRLTAAASAAALLLAVSGCSGSDDPEPSATANEQTDDNTDQTDGTGNPDETDETTDSPADQTDETEDAPDGTGNGENTDPAETDDGEAGGENPGGTDPGETDPADPGATDPPPVSGGGGGGTNPAPPVPVPGGEGSEGPSGASYGAPVTVTVGDISVNMPGNWTQSAPNAEAPDGTAFYGPGSYDSANGLIVGPVPDMDWAQIKQIAAQNRPGMNEPVNLSVSGADDVAAYNMWDMQGSARANVFLLVDDDVYRVIIGVPEGDFDQVRDYVQTIKVG